jgi:molecular chaperone DnaK
VSSIGIDFGTTNSVVAVHGPEGPDLLPIDIPPPGWTNLGFEKVLPSVLGVGVDLQATFGWTAKRQAQDKLEAVKRLFASEDSVRIGGVEYSVEMAAALLFARLKQGAADAGAPLDRAVVTIPANSRGLARFRTKLCAGLAGIDVTALINEPTAAAMAHSISAGEDQSILVFDWGGGTLDVTVLDTVAGVFIERASKGIQRSGGLDLDNLLAAAVLQEVPGHEGWSQAERGVFRLEVERAKILLSSQTEVNIELPRDGGFLEIRRDVLERAIRGKVEETRGPIDQCLRDLGITADALDHVVLVGGSSKIPAVRQFVCEVLGKEPAEGADAMTAVAEGAAVAAAILAGELDADFFVATEHALGTVSADERGVSEFSVLIDRNYKLPAKAQGSYRPLHAGQKSVMVSVIEGDPKAPLEHPDNVILKEWDVAVDPARPHEESGFTILYEYDVDGILHVTVSDDKTGETMLQDDLSFGVSRDKASLVDLARSVNATMAGGTLGAGTPGGGTLGGTEGAGANGTATGEAAGATELDAESQAVLGRVRAKIIPFVEEHEVHRLEEMCLALEQAVVGAVADTCRAALETEARKYAYLLF